METPANIFSSNEAGGGIDLRLWMGILLPPLAGGMNTMVGYMLSNYSCSIHNRHLVLLTNGITALICICAGITAYATRSGYESRTDEVSRSLLHTRRFMMALGVALSLGFLLFITAGTISTIVLRPCDL